MLVSIVCVALVSSLALCTARLVHFHSCFRSLAWLSVLYISSSSLRLILAARHTSKQIEIYRKEGISGEPRAAWHPRQRATQNNICDQTRFDSTAKSELIDRLVTRLRKAEKQKTVNVFSFFFTFDFLKAKDLSATNSEKNERENLSDKEGILFSIRMGIEVFSGIKL